MKKSELKKLIEEVISESMVESHAVLSDPNVKPLLRKLYDDTLNGRLCDEDDINALAIAAFELGLSKGKSNNL